MDLFRVVEFYWLHNIPRCVAGAPEDLQMSRGIPKSWNKGSERMAASPLTSLCYQTVFDWWWVHVADQNSSGNDFINFLKDALNLDNVRVLSTFDRWWLDCDSMDTESKNCRRCRISSIIWPKDFIGEERDEACSTECAALPLHQHQLYHPPCWNEGINYLFKD